MEKKCTSKCTIGNRQGDVWYPPIQHAPAECWWGEGKVRARELMTSSSPLAWVFPDVSTDGSCARNVPGTSYSQANPDSCHPRAWRWQSWGLNLHPLMPFTPLPPEGCLRPPWVTTYGCHAARKVGWDGNKVGRWQFLWQRIFWGPKSLKLCFALLWFRGGRWSGEEGVLSFSVPVLPSMGAGLGTKDHTLHRNIQGRKDFRLM